MKGKRGATILAWPGFPMRCCQRGSVTGGGGPASLTSSAYRSGLLSLQGRPAEWDGAE